MNIIKTQGKPGDIISLQIGEEKFLYQVIESGLIKLVPTSLEEDEKLSMSVADLVYSIQGPNKSRVLTVMRAAEVLELSLAEFFEKYPSPTPLKEFRNFGQKSQEALRNAFSTLDTKIPAGWK